MVEPLESGLRHVDFASYLEAPGRFAAADLHGDAADGAQVLGDVFAAEAVSPSGPLQEAPSLVDQGDRQPVDLWLDDHVEVLDLRQAGGAPVPRL